MSDFVLGDSIEVNVSQIFYVMHVCFLFACDPLWLKSRKIETTKEVFIYY